MSTHDYRARWRAFSRASRSSAQHSPSLAKAAINSFWRWTMAIPPLPNAQLIGPNSSVPLRSKTRKEASAVSLRLQKCSESMIRRIPSERRTRRVSTEFNDAGSIKRRTTSTLYSRCLSLWWRDCLVWCCVGFINSTYILGVCICVCPICSNIIFHLLSSLLTYALPLLHQTLLYNLCQFCCPLLISTHVSQW